MVFLVWIQQQQQQQQQSLIPLGLGEDRKVKVIKRGKEKHTAKAGKGWVEKTENFKYFQKKIY